MSSLRLPNPPGCLAYDPRVQNPYGYLPSLAAGVIFLVLFGASTALHVWQTFRYRTPWLAAFVLGAFGEFLGWVARTVAHRCSYSVLFFKMQLVLLIIGKGGPNENRKDTPATSSQPFPVSILHLLYN